MRFVLALLVVGFCGGIWWWGYVVEATCPTCVEDVWGEVRVAKRTAAELAVLFPASIGEIFECSDCDSSGKTTVISTGTRQGAWAVMWSAEPPRAAMEKK